ncbi:MAG: hypothetical protein AAB152_05540 [Candidatus Coatesbacteria bacterium]
MTGCLRILTAPGFVAGLIGALLGFAALGAWMPGDAGSAVFGTWAFRVTAVLLCVSIVANLWERLGGVTEMKVLGSWLLHFGIVLLAVAGTWHASKSTERQVELVEGQTATLGDTGVSVLLDRVDPDRREGRWRKGDAAEVTVIERGMRPRREVVAVNRPLNIGDHWLFLGLHGFAPIVGSGAAPGSAAAVVKLETTLLPRPYYWGEFQVPGSGARALGVFRPATSGHLVRDPSLEVVLRGVDGRRLGAGVARPGRPARVGGVEVALAGVRYWAAFRLTHEPGLRMVFASFWIAIAGAALTLLPRVLRGGV